LKCYHLTRRCCRLHASIRLVRRVCTVHPRSSSSLVAPVVTKQVGSSSITTAGMRGGDLHRHNDGICLNLVKMCYSRGSPAKTREHTEHREHAKSSRALHGPQVLPQYRLYTLRLVTENSTSESRHEHFPFPCLDLSIIDEVFVFGLPNVFQDLRVWRGLVFGFLNVFQNLRARCGFDTWHRI